MRKLFILWLAVIALISCDGGKSDKNAFIVEGSISDSLLNGKTVFLQKLNEETYKIEVSDSVVIKDNAFLFKGIADSAEIGIIYIKDEIRSEFVLEPGKIILSVSSNLMTRSGTALNDSLQSYYAQLDLIREKQDEIIKQFSESEQTPEQKFDLDLKLDALSDESDDLFISFIKSNINNPAGKYFAIEYLEYLNIETQEELLALADESFKSKEKIQTVIKKLNEKKALIGAPFKDFTLTNPKGKKASLSDYAGKGKYVLVDFWASWCAPCRRSMPHLVSLYDKYKTKDFEIVGISLDGDKDSWTKAIKDLQITWPQLSDLKGWNSEAAKIYNVNSIPNTLLIDKDGKIMLLNPSGTKLNKKLEELLMVND